MSGRIEVITGPMFSGKTEELVRRVRWAHYSKHHTQLFQPRENTRKARSLQEMLPSTTIHLLPRSLADAVPPDVHLVAVDEVQFVVDSPDFFISQVEQLADRGVQVVLAGLDTDYQNEPWPVMPRLLAVADEVQKRAAVCMRCHRAPATKTWRNLSATSDRAKVVVGDVDIYEARCRDCFQEKR